MSGRGGRTAAAISRMEQASTACCPHLAGLSRTELFLVGGGSAGDRKTWLENQGDLATLEV